MLVPVYVQHKYAYRERIKKIDSVIHILESQSNDDL